MISVRPVRLLAWCAAALVVAHLAGLLAAKAFDMPRDAGLPRQFDLNAEANLTAWFSSFLLLCCSVVALGLALAARSRGDRLAGRWAGMAALLLFMAVDESAQLHDMATGPLRRGLDLDFGPLYFAWLIPAVVCLVAIAVYAAPLARAVGSSFRRRLLIAAAVYVGGAVGVEMLSGVVVENGHDSLPYLLVITLEEAGELAGSLLMLSALLAILGRLHPRLSLDVGGPRLEARVEPAGRHQR